MDEQDGAVLPTCLGLDDRSDRRGPELIAVPAQRLVEDGPTLLVEHVAAEQRPREQVASRTLLARRGGRRAVPHDTVEALARLRLYTDHEDRLP